ncbi:TATE DNA Transposon [Trypanosoma theileri]|uniref:TATE DNA Transposon n=1 Tax=Trypanosoma theileri TaxID=67003 RepID=A0A1X0NZ84_9TRYP|nr:TATE DNA Transposon [Trypanosoma theileri]ORC90002.1 TATE DNA Transposon [Trypanosoma theileri]
MHLRKLFSPIFAYHLNLKCCHVKGLGNPRGLPLFPSCPIRIFNFMLPLPYPNKVLNMFGFPEWIEFRELVRRMALNRNWKWSTICKVMALISGALLNLPLYSNQSKGIDISKDPSWRAATRAAHKFENREPTNPPAPVTYEQMKKAHAALERECPIAALYLMMMWCCAARAGDIATLLKKDVRVEQTTESDSLTDLTMTIRYGKGAHFRGPYPVATILPRKDASVLQQVLNDRLRKQRLFPDAKALRDRVLQALRNENVLSSLPSVRKGSARHMAAQGVPEEQIMRLTGHTRLETLQRYLGYGHQLTREAELARDSVAQALREPSS